MPIILDWNHVDPDPFLSAMDLPGITSPTCEGQDDVTNAGLDTPPNAELLDAVASSSRSVEPPAKETTAESQSTTIDSAVAAWALTAVGTGDPLQRFVNTRGSTRLLRQQFRVLVKWWRDGTQHESSLTKRFNHPAYQGIIAMGRPLVPLILQELKAQPDFWFAALKLITGKDPVPVSSRGRLKEMTQAWLDWGRANGIRL
jgi:hypothetical protein